MLLRRACAAAPPIKSAENCFVSECVSLVHQKRCFFASDLSAIAMAAKKGSNSAPSSRDRGKSPSGSDDAVSMEESRLYNSNSGERRGRYNGNGQYGNGDMVNKGGRGGSSKSRGTGTYYYNRNSSRTTETIRSREEGNPDHQIQSQVARPPGRKSFPAVATIEREEIEMESASEETTSTGSTTSGISSSSSSSALFISESSFTSARDVGRYGDVAAESSSSSSSGERAFPRGASGDELSATSTVSGAAAIAQMRSHQKQIREMFNDQPIIAINAKRDGANSRGVHEIPLLPVRYLKYASHGRRGPLHSKDNTKQSPSAQRLTSELGLPITSIATPYASRAEERLHQVRQHNLLAQIGMTKRELEGKVTPTHQAAEIAKALLDSPGYAVKGREARDSQNRLPFRCLSCFHIFEALPSKLLKHVSLDGPPAVGGKGGGGDGGTGGGLSSAAALESETKKHLARRVKFRSVSQLAKWKTANTIEARRLEEERNPTKCPNCGSRRVQWLMEYCHRSLHTSKLR